MRIYSIIVCALLLCVNVCDSSVLPVCTSGATIGSGDIAAASVNSPDSTDVNTTLLMANVMGTIQCCGIVTGWKFYVEGKAFVSVHVWRPVSGQTGTYTMLGKNGWRNRVNGISELIRDVRTRNQIHVVPGDVIAIFQEGPAIVRYITCDPASPTNPTLCAEDLLMMNTNTEPAPGEQVTFTIRQSTNLGTSTVRGYAVQATLDTKEPVNCTNSSVTISDTLGVGDSVTSVTAANIDTQHPQTVYSIVSIVQPLSVTIHPTTGAITVSGSLVSSYPSTNHVVTVRVTDVCGGSGVCDVTITVTNDPKPIKIISLPGTKQLDAWTIGDIFSFQISSQRDVDNAACSVTSTLPEVSSFGITRISSTDYMVGITSTASLVSVDSVVVFITCQNDAGHLNDSTLLVTLNSNSQLSQTNGGNGMFAALLTVLGLIVLVAIVTLVLFYLTNKGIIRMWPVKHRPNTRHITVREDLNHVTSLREDHVTPKSEQPRNEPVRQTTWHANRKLNNTHIWNTLDKLYLKETSTLALYQAAKSHSYHTMNGLANPTSRESMASHPVNGIDVARLKKSYHKIDDNYGKWITKKPWIP